jgi:hypothetical protein
MADQKLDDSGVSRRAARTSRAGGSTKQDGAVAPGSEAMERADRLRQLTNDALDVRAALRLAGGVACDTATQISQGFIDDKVVTYGGTNGQPPAAHTADGRWSPTRDHALAARLEDEIRRRGLEADYVHILARLTPPATSGTAAPGPSELFGLIHAAPRLRTIAALAAIGETG